MSYFERFPSITYMGHKIKDVTVRFSFVKNLTNNISAFEPYRIKDGDRIEDIAFKLYGSSELHWIIILTNNIVDPFYDLPLSELELTEYIASKYGSPNVNLTHHYEDVNGRIVPEGTPGATIITNTEYEASENERFREIKIMKPEYVARVRSELDRLLGEL